MSTEIEQSRIDFEAYVSSITGSQKPLISMHWTGQGYSEASDLEPFWQCWTAAQIVATAHQTQGNGHPAIRLELVRYLTDGLHIRKWENIGDLPPGIHTFYSGQVQYHSDTVAALTQRIDLLEGLLRSLRTNSNPALFSAGQLDAVDAALKPAKIARQYFYRSEGCDEAHPIDTRCGCWHDEGSGPWPMGLSNHELSWRTKPAGGRSNE